MGLGQSMITIGAMFMLSLLILNVNRAVYNTNETMAQSRYNILAVSVASSIYEDAVDLAFDEATVSGNATSTASLSTNLGIDGSENSKKFQTFDDFDDYNAFKIDPRQDTIVVQNSGGKRVIFNSLIRVDYVTEANLNTISASKTWHKRISIKVFCPEIRDPKTGITDTIRLSTVFSYWYFR